METAWNSLGFEINNQKYASFSTDDRKFIGLVHRLKDQNPDEVIIKAEPQNNDGCLYAWIPQDWLRISKPVRYNLTNEEREIRRERLKRNKERMNDLNPDSFSGIREQKPPSSAFDGEILTEQEDNDIELEKCEMTSEAVNW